MTPSMGVVNDEDVWSADESSQLFRQYLEHEIQVCQSGQHPIVDLVSVAC